MMRTFTLSPKEIEFDKEWPVVEDGIRKIITLTGAKGMPIYESIYKLCTASPKPFYEDLYLHLKRFLEDYLDDVYKNITSLPCDVFLMYIKTWQTYSVGCEYLHHLFRYLNQWWVRPLLHEESRRIGGIILASSSVTDVQEVITLCWKLWKERLYVHLKPKLIASALSIVEALRSDKDASVGAVTTLVANLVKLGSITKGSGLGLYQQDFEAPLLQRTSDYYVRESSAFIVTHGVTAYLRKAETRRLEEDQRTKFFHSTTTEKLRSTVICALVESHKELLSAECETYLKDNRVEDIRCLYSLLKRIPDGIEPLLKYSHDWMVEIGTQALRSIPPPEQTDSQKVVSTLISFYQKSSTLVSLAFGDDVHFVAALDKACRRVLNEAIGQPSNASELLARYCDTILRKGKHNQDESLLEEKLSQVITLFKYLDEKDIFQKFFSIFLAKRLINDLSISSFAEGLMISGLKQVCGFEYVSKLSRMFSDITLSAELKEAFNASDLGKNFSVLVLTAGSWPLQTNTSSFLVPREVEPWIHSFQKFYVSRHQGRRITWLHHLSKGDLKCFSMKRQYEFQVTCHQASILLLLNTEHELSLESIEMGTGLSKEESLRTLKTLVDSKVILQNQSTFSFNSSFTSKRLKLRLLAPLRAERPEERPNTYDDINKDRNLYLQAAIVRIMKARKEIRHVQLVQEVVEQAKGRFQPSISVIKKCIEFLIEKEYLERYEGQSDRYTYVA